MIPVGIAWLLSDLGTEDRSPLKFFGSFIKYHLRKIKGNNLYRNKKIPKLKTYSFNDHLTYAKQSHSSDTSLAKNKKESKEKGYIIMNNKKDDSNIGNDELEEKEAALLSENDKANDEENNEIENKKLTPLENGSSDLARHLFGTDDHVHEGVTDKQNKPLLTDQPEGSSSKDNLKSEINKVDNTKTRKTNFIDKLKDPKNNKTLTYGMVVATVLVLSVFVLSLSNVLGTESSVAEQGSNAPNEEGGAVVSEEEHEENLLKGIRHSSTQNYEEAVKYFEKVNFDSLDHEDKEIVLLAYLFTDQPEVALDLDSDFDEVIASYYVAKEDFSALKSLEERSDEFKFEIALNDEDYEKVIDLRNNVYMDETREEGVIKAYIELEKFDEGLTFAEKMEKTELVDKVNESKEAHEKEQEKKEKAKEKKKKEKKKKDKKKKKKKKDKKESK